MLWIKVAVGLKRHRKVIELGKELSRRPTIMVGHLTSFWGEVLEQQEDGDLSTWSDQMIARAADWPGDARKFVRALQKHGFLDDKIVHDWIDFSGPYLTKKYKTSKIKRLREIWLKHGRTYGCDRKPKGSPKEAQRKTKGSLDKIRLDKTRNTTEPCAFFDLFFKAYPKRKGKVRGRGLCESFFREKIPAIQHAEVVRASENYAKSDQALRGFAMDPIRFLRGHEGNGVSWRDYVTAEESATSSANGEPKPERREKCPFCPAMLTLDEKGLHFREHEASRDQSPIPQGGATCST